MGVSVFDYVSSEASSSTTGGWNTAENQDPSTVNDGMRAHKQNVANFLKDQGGINTTAGSANSQTVTLSEPIATTVPTGFFFTVKFGFTNTSSTVNLNVNSIGNARVKVNYDGLLADPIPGDLRAGAYGNFIYDGTYFVLLNAQQQASYAPGTLYGLTLSNDAGDTTNDIGIAAGSARDGADSANIDQTTSLIKQIDALWAVGTNAGGRDTGSTADGTWFIWKIKRPDTGVDDVLFSLSSSAPTMPTNYTIKRIFGVVVRSGGVNGVPFLFAGPVATRGQVPFPALQVPSSNVNTLDDYVEGTTTPTVTSSSGSFTTVNCTLKYTKIGNLVAFSAVVTITSVGTASGIVNVPLPFTAATTSSCAGVNNNNIGVVGSILGSGAVAALFKYDATSIIAGSSSLNFSGLYQV